MLGVIRVWQGWPDTRGQLAEVLLLQHPGMRAYGYGEYEHCGL